jgi:hypothetical protein
VNARSPSSIHDVAISRSLQHHPSRFNRIIS